VIITVKGLLVFVDIQLIISEPTHAVQCEFIAVNGQTAIFKKNLQGATVLKRGGQNYSQVFS